jgi:membrane dipeptidase
VSPFGEKVVAEMNRLGIMVDVSHLSDQAFRRVLEISRAPVIASHSSCRHFTPGWERNMDDDMIRLLAARGGVLQINFGSAFLLDEAQRQSTAFWEKFEEHLRTHELGPADPEARRFAEEYWKGTPKVRGDLSIVADHIDHVVELVGVDHVGFGSDFDGVDTLPEGLEDVSKYPGLLRVLLERGYGEEDLRKICGENLLRVWSEVERVAAELRRGGGAS